MAEPQHVFWYYAGNRSASVVIDGEPTLASPHKYVLAPAGQPWPKPIAHLFRRKTPPREIMDAFGEAARRTAEYRRILEADAARAKREAQKAEKERMAAARKGKVAGKMEMAQAISEKGKQDPPKEGEKTPDEPKPDESSNRRRGRGRGRKSKEDENPEGKPSEEETSGEE